MLTVFREGWGDEEREGNFLRHDGQKLAGFALRPRSDLSCEILTKLLNLFKR